MVIWGFKRWRWFAIFIFRGLSKMREPTTMQWFWHSTAEPPLPGSSVGQYVIYIYIFYVCWLSPFCCCCWWWWWNSAMCWQNVIFCWWLMVETYHTCNQNWISTDRMKFTYLRGQLCYWFSPCLLMNLFIWLMISNMAFSFHFIYGLILPIDELMIFKMVKPC